MNNYALTVAPDDDSPIGATLRIEVTTDGAAGWFATNARACGIDRGSREELVLEALGAHLMHLALNGVDISAAAVRVATENAANALLAGLHPHPADSPPDDDPHGLPA